MLILRPSSRHCDYTVVNQIDDFDALVTMVRSIVSDVKRNECTPFFRKKKKDKIELNSIFSYITCTVAISLNTCMLISTSAGVVWGDVMELIYGAAPVYLTC